MASRQEKLKEILGEAVARSDPAARAAYLDEACAGDERLRAEVETLAEAYDEEGGSVEQTLAVSDLTRERPGTVVGRYKVLQEIGEGGFGVVFMAEQLEPVQRKVALKIIKAGMDTREVIARFEAERQALALMDHPNIARVLDAGATESSRPYFVMELVKGIKITDYCDQKNLSTAERLQLFIQVCHAVQHAHQKGIIHRDLKPSNVLVTETDGEAVPKVIDFGIAKATGQRLTDKTLFTRYEQMIGTPAYMSPEQAGFGSLDVDTRTDIYTLGVLLYELLTGVTPFDKDTLAKVAFEEIRRLIRETEPPKPSTRLTEIARNPQSEIRNPKWKEVRGDLDWIVMKALEKDRRRRYETANDFAQDIERHLKHQPVAASPPSALYQARKFVRRHRVGVAMGAVVAVALLAGLSLALVGLRRALAAERRATASEGKTRTEAARSAQVARFLEDMLQGVGPAVARGRDTALLREILDNTVERLGKDLKAEPEVEAQLRNTIGKVYLALGDLRQAEEMQRKALELRRSRLGNEHADVASSLHSLAWVLLDQRKFAEAESRFGEALAMRRKLLGAEHDKVAAVLDGLGCTLREQGRLGEAEACQREALTIERKQAKIEAPAVAVSLQNLGNILREQGKLSEAEAVFREALAMMRKHWTNGHPNVAIPLLNLGIVLRDQGRLPEAEAVHREALAIGRKLLGNDHPELANFLSTLVFELHAQGKLAEAEVLLNEALAILRRRAPDREFEMAGILLQLAKVVRDQGNLAKARQLEEEVLSVSRRVLDPEHPHTLDLLAALAVVYRDQGDLAKARELEEEVLSVSRRVLGIEHRVTLKTAHNLAVRHMDSGESAQAEALLEEVAPAFRRVFGPEHPQTLLLLGNLAVIYRAQNKLAEAEQLWREVLPAERRVLGAEHPYSLSSMIDLAWAYSKQNKLAEAQKLHEEVLAVQRRALGPGHPDTVSTMNGLAWMLATCTDSKVRDGRSALRLAEEAVAATSRTNASYLDTLAAAFAEAGGFAKAVSVQQEVIALPDPEHYKKGYEARLRLYEAGSPFREAEKKSPEPPR